MINQYTIPLSTKGNVEKSFLSNAPTINVALDLCFVKKRLFFYQEVVFSKLSSIEFKGKLLKQ